MEEPNDKISGLQFGIMVFFVSASLFVGLGNVAVFNLDSRNAWLACLIAAVICIIPFILFLYIYNYQPSKNIFEKNKILYGKWIGTVFNIVISIFMLYITLLVLWSTTSFAISMYLTKTPEAFIAGIILLASVYAVIKGIETIGRVGEVLFAIAIVLLLIIYFGLFPQINYNNFKPFLEGGINPIIRLSLNITSYIFTPIYIMLIIPKNNIVNKKHFKRYLIGGIVAGLLTMFLTFFIIPGVITPELASIYRFPAYYVQRKISIGGFINNLENILSLHLFFHSFIFISLDIYALKKFAENTFKFKSNKWQVLLPIIIGILILLLRSYIFEDSVVAVSFMKYQFPLLFSGSLLILILISVITIFIKRRLKKA